MLEQVSVNSFRNIDAADLDLAPGLNLVLGENGAGKTSLLEAVHCLARVRSFVPGSLDRLKGIGSQGWWVRGGVRVGEARHTLGVGRSGRQTQVRLDGEGVGKLSDVAWLLPVQVLNTRSTRLLTEGPGERRAFLNWAVFHVEQGFSDVWRRYDRALRQRNAALRQGDLRLAAAWEPEMAEAGEEAHVLRKRVVEALAPLWGQWIGYWLEEGLVACSYRRGWPEDKGLADSLADGRDREMRMGHSVYGPHRADLRITSRGGDAGTNLSRGQQKLVVAALRFGLVSLMVQGDTQGQPLLLIDDLAAELDQRNQALVVDEASRLGAQLIATAITREELATGSTEPEGLFHVEQGHYRSLL